MWKDIKLSDAPPPLRAGSPVDQAIDEMLDESEQPVVPDWWDDSDSSSSNNICDEEIPDFVDDSQGFSAYSMGDDDIPDFVDDSDGQSDSDIGDKWPFDGDDISLF